MTTSFPGSPRFLKGAIVGVDPINPIPNVIAFQYNPDSLSRTIQPQAIGEGGDRSEVTRLKGAPIETIKVDIELDATDALERGDSTAVSLGIYPQLSALETLVYPRSSLVIANTVLLALGTIEILAPTGPFTLFIWGSQRVLPVRLTDFSITEEAHDVNLNPMRAKVSLGMRILSYNDLSFMQPGYHLFLSHQIVKETMATLGSVNSSNSVGIGNISLF